MFTNYIKVAFRILQRSKAYSFINIAGLSLGMACFVLISMWIIDETSYDNFHENIDRLYRINSVNDELILIRNAAFLYTLSH